MPLVKAHEFLWNTAKYPAKEICVVFGKDTFFKSNVIRHLRDQVLSNDDAEFSLMRFDGQIAVFKDVLLELSASAMFGGGRKFVLIDDADKFVSKFRSELEKYAENPSKSAVLVLQLPEFPSNTNLYKKLAVTGLLVEAAGAAEKEMPKWICRWSEHRYQIHCEIDAADLLFQRIGSEHALLDMELAKLSLTADAKRGITVQQIEQQVGSWRSRTAFEMLDCALSAQPAAAVRLLDSLMLAGENAIAVYAQIASALRKLAAATQSILDAESQGKKITVRSALENAGVKGFVLAKTEKQLLNLGRERGGKMLNMLIRLDLDLKGGSRSDPRQILETFLVSIAAPELRKT
ncbi:MAG: DNA polymerase III subunit delta [Planctomycetaceae bacterium]|jgi:DNA polymerase-3 subunit delta|nr:DNA polymerase III subunit delta [Planctomycetaceae bacterium]